MKKIFFIDYDNTIFSHQTWTVPESARKALADMQKAGHIFVLSSGRAFRMDAPEFEEFDFHPDCTIGCNGAIVEAEGQVLREKYLDPKLQSRIMDFIKERGYCLTTSYNNRWYVSNMELLAKERTAPRKEKDLPLGEKEFFSLRDKHLFSFFLHDAHAAGQDLQEHFPELKLMYMHDDRGGADVVPKDNSKADGMQVILEHYHASPADAVAIGDSMNDYDMLKMAGLGIAMGNAMQGLRDVADYITGHVDENGLRDAVRYALCSTAPSKQ